MGTLWSLTFRNIYLLTFLYIIFANICLIILATNIIAYSFRLESWKLCGGGCGNSDGNSAGNSAPYFPHYSPHNFFIKSIFSIGSLKVFDDLGSGSGVGNSVGNSVHYFPDYFRHAVSFRADWIYSGTMGARVVRSIGNYSG